MATETDTTTPNDGGEGDLFPQPSLSALSGRRKNTGAGTTPPARPSEREAPDAEVEDAGYAGQPLDDDQGVKATSKARPQRRPRRATRARAPRPDNDETTGVPVSFQVSEGVRRRLDKAQAQALTNTRTRKGHLEFILEALNAGAEEGWDEVVKASVPERKASRFGGERPLKDRDYVGTGSESLYMRMDEETVAELDRATEEAKLPDRNKLVAMCLNRYLPGRKERPTGSSG
ncbi:hypothetical protein ACH419_30680 [Streptomyces bobili]|uniref:hypothetical protein n=1 Tax=Streptomyces bobili TaxID=67280 RepID=UPI00379B15EA